jgi:dihydrofolate reductase
MGKLVVSQFMTLDGVIEAPGGGESFEHGGWVFECDRGAEGDRFKLEELQKADALLLGRGTYQGFADAWPSRTDEAGFADKLNSMPKYVVSTTLKKADWTNSTVIRRDVVEEIAELKHWHEGDILINGSPGLVRALMDHDLIDEYRLMVFPVVLNSGKRLFGDSGRMARLRLVDATPVGQDGVIIITYEPAAKTDQGPDGDSGP